MRPIAVRYVLIYIAIVLLPLALVLTYATQFLNDADEARRSASTERLLGAYEAAMSRVLQDVERDASTLRQRLVSPSGEQFLTRVFAAHATAGEWRAWVDPLVHATGGARVTFLDPGAGRHAVAPDSLRTLTPDERRAWTVRLARGRWRERSADALLVGRALPGGESGGDRALEVRVPLAPLAERAAASLGDQRDVAFFVVDPAPDTFLFHTNEALRGTRAQVADVPTRPVLDGALVVGVVDGTNGLVVARARDTLWLVGVLAALGAGLVLAFHARSLGRDLRVLSDAARRFGDGQLDHRVSSWWTEEVGDVARDMNAMAERWDRDLRTRDADARFDVLARVRRRVTAELEDIHAGLVALASNVSDPNTPRVILRGAASVMTRLAARLRDTEQAALEGRTYVVEPKENGRPVDLGPVIESCASAVAARTDGRIRVQLEVPPRTPATSIAEETLRGVFMTVVDNAARAMPEGGTLKVEVVPEALRLTVHVIDSGQGMPSPFLRRRLFQPFASAWHDEESFGLALHRARHVLRQLGGDILVSSREEVGTRVSLRLPIARA